MNKQNVLQLDIRCPIKAQNAGLFISRGQGTHPTRVIDSHELIFVKAGELALWEEDRTFSLEAGQTLHLWPGRHHGGLGPLPDGLVFYWIHFEVTESFNADENLTARVEVPQVNRVCSPEKLESLYRYFIDEQESGTLQATSAALLVMLMLCEAAKVTSQDKDDSDIISALAARAHAYIAMNLDDPISSGKIAEALGYNPDYLGRVFRTVYGYTLTEAIHRQRVRRACRYLRDSDMTIEQIALACGFADSDYFRRLFRRYTQCTPTAYRSTFARVHINTH